MTQSKDALGTHTAALQAQLVEAGKTFLASCAADGINDSAACDELFNLLGYTTAHACVVRGDGEPDIAEWMRASSSWISDALADFTAANQGR
ncbi:MAG: hypothetical protein GC206_17130 [Alphaproteobacteria bacterium]|nr:hypothetical protein [Alphaproteobacteria bacterium]